MLPNCIKFLPFSLFTISIFPSLVIGCAQQYRRELNYLDFYLGIRPANEQGEIGVQEHSIDKYVERSSQLACDFRADCLWTNAPSDGLLDSTDFFLFQKTDRKAFPIQVGPGNAHPPPGTQFAFAGNLTKEPQSAVLISAPIACQSSVGIFSFEYWLYNSARLEVILLKVNPIRGHLTVVERPPTDCHFLKPNGLCRVEIRRQQQPFRLAVRAFKLQDPAVGAFAMFTRFRYEAELCGFHDRPPIFGAIPTARWIRQRRPIRRAADLDCGNEDGLQERFQDCLWADFARTASAGGAHTAHWAVGENIQLWEQIVRSSSHPNGQFYFQYIDPIADFPLPHLRSVLVPCTKSPSTLTFKFWLSSGVQAQVCTLSTDNVALSCVYLNEADAPGPLTIDVDTADHQPFRFSFNVLRVDRAANGGGAIIVLDELKYTGWLCHESGPTTLAPSITPLSSLFQLRPLPTAGSVDASLAFPNSLECNFEAGDLCPHWMHSANDLEAEEGDWEEESEEVKSQQQRFRLGIVPRGHLSFPMDGRFRGVHSAVALLDHRAQEEQFAILTSRPISCAQRGRISITYFATPGAQLSICANEQCVSARRRPHRPIAGFNHQMMPPIEMSVALNSIRPFRIRIVAERNRTVPISATDPYEPFVLIKRIATKNGEGFCRLENPVELTCLLLACHFAMDGLCKYKTMFLAVGDVPFVHKAGRGIVAQFAKGMRRAVLRSPQFRLPSKGHVEMRLEASLSTFGSRLYICPDEQQKEGRNGLGLLGRRAHQIEDDEDVNGGADGLLGRQLGHCELLLGPKIEHAQMESLVVQLDPELRHFALVAVHDKFEQFGEAEIVLGRVELTDESGQPIC